MKNLISFSGGVESSAMCVLFGNKANALFCDTGFEHEKLYSRLDKVEKKIREFHNNDFKIIRIKPEISLPDYIIENKYYPSAKARFCTRMFKINPIDKYLKNLGDIELMIGLNSDEKDKRVGNLGKLKNVKYTYPLIENNINRAMCEALLQKINLLPNFPAYMHRGGCIGCFFKTRKEYEAMFRLNENEFKYLIDLEKKIQDKRKEFYTIISSIPEGLEKFKENILNQSEMFDLKSFYQSKNESACGIFCHR
jgi:3'-phosphoadenosine 5'-phosphosulfate sulfotransferase (PAPS reductase)/FAD synthetase